MRIIFLEDVPGSGRAGDVKEVKNGYARNFLLPRKLARMCEAVWRGDLKTARRLRYDLFEINQAVFYDTNPIPMKYMMKRLAIMPQNEHRLPMMSATKELEKRLNGVLKRAKLV